MAYTYKGKVIREGRSWVDDQGITHPTNWGSWSTEEKESKGLVYVNDPDTFDSRFYWDASTPKALEDTYAVDGEGNPILDEFGNQIVTEGLKTVQINKVKQQANHLLAETDWYRTRYEETGEIIPINVTVYREAVRKSSNDKEAAVLAVDTFEDFIALMSSTEDETSIMAEWPSIEEDHPVRVQRVTMRQARLALLSAGILDSVETAITDPAALIEWEYADSLDRDNILVQNIGTNLGLTEQQIDDLFIAAYSL